MGVSPLPLRLCSGSGRNDRVWVGGDFLRTVVNGVFWRGVRVGEVRREGFWGGKLRFGPTVA